MFVAVGPKHWPKTTETGPQENDQENSGAQTSCAPQYPTYKNQRSHPKYGELDYPARLQHMDDLFCWNMLNGPLLSWKRKTIGPRLSFGLRQINQWAEAFGIQMALVLQPWFHSVRNTVLVYAKGAGCHHSASLGGLQTHQPSPDTLKITEDKPKVLRDLHALVGCFTPSRDTFFFLYAKEGTHRIALDELCLLGWTPSRQSIGSKSRSPGDSICICELFRTLTTQASKGDVLPTCLSTVGNSASVRLWSHAT